MRDGCGAEGTRAIIAAFLANLGIALAKVVGFAVTRSSSMLAESVHSFADTGNQALLLFGGCRARRAPTRRHSFGYGRERYFWSFVVALVLFSLGSLFALDEGVEKLRDPHAGVGAQHPRRRDGARVALAAHGGRRGAAAAR
jgi:cation diffusion facilitator family transporter